MESFLPRLTLTDAADAQAVYEALTDKWLTLTPDTPVSQRLAVLVVQAHAEYVRLSHPSDSSTESE